MTSLQTFNVSRVRRALLVAMLILTPTLPLFAQVPTPVGVSGIYPSLTMYNEHAECGVGAVVPWAGKLWAVTYAPHQPNGSTDKLYAISPDLTQHPFAGSVGGTPANRFIHDESQQLFIGPYAIDRAGEVRVIPPQAMPGRLTGAARHLTDPKNKIYIATMEEGLYEVDVATLDATPLYADDQGQIHAKKNDAAEAPIANVANLPGYHGKGLFSGQGRVVYANNGEPGRDALSQPHIPAGVLAEWDGRADDWRVVRRNQFTEVSGPGGIHGNACPETDPLWAVGWDHRSLLLNVLHDGKWSTYRLPKGSHSYDGAHGWNTEWPRIRDVGEGDLLMTMHGVLWRFPRTFAPGASAGIAPRSAYLKVVGDFCRWQDRVVFGCDDSAASEFLNTRRAKGKLAGPGESQSNLWFVAPQQLDRLGPAIGRGAVWIDDDLAAGVPSDPFLIAGFDRRGIHLAHNTDAEVAFTLQIDRRGDGQWQDLTTETLPTHGYRWIDLNAVTDSDGVWLRIVPQQACQQATAFFQLAQADDRSAEPDPMFAALPAAGRQALPPQRLWVHGAERRKLGVAVADSHDYYELDAALDLQRVDNHELAAQVEQNAPLVGDVFSVDAASVIYVDDDGRRWRLPKGDLAFDDPEILNSARIDREVVTERDLFNCHGTFYELPAANAGGFAKIRPIATHNKQIADYCSYRGLLVLAGASPDAPPSEHVVRSSDNRVALWVGMIDDLWRLGKPRGVGGPWSTTPVEPHQPSDSYLMTGYDRKSFTLRHDADEPVEFTLEIDPTGAGDWQVWKRYTVSPNNSETDRFPRALNAYWLRTTVDKKCRASAQFTYD